MASACKIIALALTLILILATTAHGDIRVGDPFALKIGESAQVDGITVGFDAVPYDGRCPTGLYCFWEGDAECVLWAQAPDLARAVLTVHTSTMLGRVATYAGRRITLVALDPYPLHENSPAPDTYVVGLTATHELLTAVEPSTWSRIKAMYR